MKCFVTILALSLLAGCRPPQVAEDLTGGNPDRGVAAIAEHGCAACHTIPGIAGAEGRVGPPLTHMGSRGYVAGVLVNNPANLERWILNPPAVDSQTAMPNLRLSASEARDIASYLYTLK